MNGYLKLDIKLHKVKFSELWHNPPKKNTQQTLRDFFLNNPNTALRALYSINKDLFRGDVEHMSVMEPEAKELDNIRNHIEHKNIKIVSGEGSGESAEKGFTYTIGYNSFEKKTMKMLKLVRASIMYTSFAIQFEENRRAEMCKKSVS